MVSYKILSNLKTRWERFAANSNLIPVATSLYKMNSPRESPSTIQSWISCSQRKMTSLKIWPYSKHSLRQLVRKYKWHKRISAVSCCKGLSSLHKERNSTKCTIQEGWHLANVSNYTLKSMKGIMGLNHQGSYAKNTKMKKYLVSFQVYFNK